MERQASSFEQDSTSTEELETAVQAYKEGSEDKYNWVINMMAERSLKPLMLTAGNLESGTFSPSTSDPTLSELGVSGAASSIMAESFSFLVANSCV